MILLRAYYINGCIIISILLFVRCKAYNACQVIHMIVDIFSPYMQARLMNAALGKTNNHFIQKLILGKEKITKLSDFHYEVASEAGESDIYNVYVDVGFCSCPAGVSGAMCKHHRSVLIHYFLTSYYLFKGTPEEKHALTVVAMGSEKAPSFSFFRSLAESAQQSDTQLLGNMQGSSNSADVPDIENVEVAEPSQRPNTVSTSETRSLNEQLIQTYVDLIRSNIDMDSSESTDGLKYMCSVAQRIKNPQQMLSYMYKSPDSVPHKSFGKKIHVQPTSIARRPEGAPRGVAPLGKGRRPAGLSGVAVKRKRNLAYNIRLNQRNATSH